MHAGTQARGSFWAVLIMALYSSFSLTQSYAEDCTCHGVPIEHVVLAVNPITMENATVTVVMKQASNSRSYSLRQSGNKRLDAVWSPSLKEVKFTFEAKDQDSDVCEPGKKDIFAKLTPMTDQEPKVIITWTGVGSPPVIPAVAFKQDGDVWTAIWNFTGQPGEYSFEFTGTIQDQHDQHQESDDSDLIITGYRSRLVVNPATVDLVGFDAITGNQVPDAKEKAAGALIQLASISPAARLVVQPVGGNGFKRTLVFPDYEKISITDSRGRTVTGDENLSGDNAETYIVTQKVPWSPSYSLVATLVVEKGTELVGDNSVKLVPVKAELKVTHPQNPGPTGSAAKYNNSPNVGSADNLFSTWDNEQLRIDVAVQPASFSSSLPPGFITWSAAGMTIPDNALTHTFTWLTTGNKEVTISFPYGDLVMKVNVDVPDVGAMTEQEALAALSLLGPALPGQIIIYGLRARSYVNDPANGFGPPFGYQRWDAFRHAYWNALCVSDALITSGMTELVTTGHEYNNKHGTSATGGSVPPQQAFNATMDLRNNALGRGCAHTSLLGLPDESAIVSDINAKYGSGELWIWDGPPCSEGNSQGILVRSNGAKIY